MFNYPSFGVLYGFFCGTSDKSQSDCCEEENLVVFCIIVHCFLTCFAHFIISVLSVLIVCFDFYNS